MLMIQGALSLVPVGVQVLAGELKVEEDGPSQPAIIFTFVTHSGPVQAAIPTIHVDGIIENMKEEKNKADEKIPQSDLVVAGSMSDVQQYAEAQQQLFEAEDGKP